MADGVVLDLYDEDLDKDFASQSQDDFTGDDGVDLYDDIGGPVEAVSAATVTVSAAVASSGDSTSIPGVSDEPISGSGSNGVYHSNSGNVTPNNIGRRYQLYVGNLTWWTTDQDISNSIREIGVNDFQEVKFFENRSNGQSKGYCLISLGSEPSLRVVLDRLPKKELHGQAPVVTYPTKQALNQFESLQKTRPVPPSQNGPPRGPAPPNMGVGGHMPPHPGSQGVQPGHPTRMMNPNMPPGQYRPQHMPQGPPVGPNSGPPRMQPPMHQGGPMGPQQVPGGGGGPPRYPPNQGQWSGQPRPNGPRPGLPNGPPQRPQMFQGPPGGMPMRGPRPEWNRPPMHGGFPPQGPPGVPQQGPPHMQGPPRGPPPQMGGGGPPGAPGGPAPHVNPAFFNNPGGPPQHPGGPPMNGPHGPPGLQGQQGMSGMPPQHGPPPHFGQQGGPRGPWPPQQKPPGSFADQPIGPQLSEVEFEEIMGRNRTVSSSAIARAVSDAAAGEFTSAIETLATAISLIKQSKVAHDERCKILISSLQDTLHGIQTKSYNRRERSRSRDRTHRQRPRRDRSTSRYRERSRDREREREREREGGSYRERSRSRERERPAPDHYRDDSSSRSTRPRKSPEQAPEAVGEAPPKRSYYDDERYRSSDRDRERDRDRDRERRDRERDRDRREEHRSRH